MLTINLIDKYGYRITPNIKKLGAIVKGLIRTNGECPCDNKGKTLEDRMCPCKDFREEGHCCCGLYEKNEEL